MIDREKVISTFEKIISVCKEDGCDFVDLTFEDAEQILALLKEQNGLMLALDQSNAVNGYLNAEVERLNVLLKEQEARVMTLDEVKAFDWDYCYLEEERLHGKEYRIICGDYALTCITWSCIASMRIQHGDDNYGKKWRCWTEKPTEDQRQEAKWE